MAIGAERFGYFNDADGLCFKDDSFDVNELTYI